MREPLNSFAARIARCGELNEFLEGICDAYGVSPDTIVHIGRLLQTRAAKRNIANKEPRFSGVEFFVEDDPLVQQSRRGHDHGN
jgi:hypothetical protein